MPDGIMIAVTVVLVIAGVIISHFVTVSQFAVRMQNRRSEMQNQRRVRSLMMQ